MPHSVTIRRPEGPIDADIRPPASKSVANRALVLASLAGDPELVAGVGSADDTRILQDLLAGRPAIMHCGDGGTTFRFLLAWACVQEGGEYLITGNPRLLQRPHAPLVQALRELGADITREESGYRVRGRAMEGGSATLHSPESSQYISALLLVAARFKQGLRLAWTGTRLSAPYVQMTITVCRSFGIPIRADGSVIEVGHALPKLVPFAVPGDWSGASFWYQVAALSAQARIGLNGLVRDGLQGDQAVADLLGGLVRTEATGDGVVLTATGSGANQLFGADLTDTPDLFQPLAFLMAALGREARFTGLHNLPLKETDRLQAVADALKALGCRAHYADGSFQLQGPVRVQSPPPFDPQGDHRMAMSLVPMALVCDEVTIRHPDVVNKSYPGFWNDLGRAGFRLELH